jgi:hypothetical protein
MGLDRSPRSSLQEVQSGISTEMEWINQVEYSVFSHSFAKRQRRNPFGYPDFHQTLAIIGPALERRVLRGRVLSNRGTQAEPGAYRMFQQWNTLDTIRKRRFQFKRQIENSVSQIHPLFYTALVDEERLPIFPLRVASMNTLSSFCAARHHV